MSIKTTEHIQGTSVCRFADIEILRYRIDGFESLPIERKLLVYHLSEAALAGRDITFDQNGRYNLQLRHLLEGIYEHYEGDKTATEWLALKEYLYRLWFASGIHHHYGGEKFEPKFSQSFVKNCLNEIQKRKGVLLEYSPSVTADLLEEVFNPERSPRRTVQDGAEDLLRLSSVNFYHRDVSQAKAEAFYTDLASKATDEECTCPPSYGLNSRLSLRSDKSLYEQICKIGGLYGEALNRISTHLKSALAYTESEQQRESILALLDYYRGGDLNAYNHFCTIWVQDTTPQVDFINGFTETYTDPLGMKGSWEGLVHIRNEAASNRTKILSREAAWFEAHAPIDKRFKKDNPKGITATVVTLAMLAGDAYPATPIGINLPNADWIRAQFGSKSVTIDNIHEAYRLACRNNGMDEAFIPNEDVRNMLAKYEGVTEALHTDLHECLGHGSGQLLTGVSPDALGAYGSTIEEARADLFALYYMADEKLVELGLLPNTEAYKACYYRYLLNGLVTQLVRIRPGHKIEEAHMRNRALIARYILARAAENKHIELRGIELIINDYQEVRQSIAALLAEVQRIKSEGDYHAAKALVEGYAIEVSQDMHTEILNRYTKLNIAPYKGFVNPKLELIVENDMIVDVVPTYTEGYAEQMMRYSKEYSTLSIDPVAVEEVTNPEPSEQTLAIAKELRTGLRTSMDGIVSNSMREKGLHYGINFGLTLEYIKRRAEHLPASAELARYLLSRDVRELKLIGHLIYPSEEVSMPVATVLASSSFSNPELRDCLAKHLFDRCQDAPLWALAWILDRHKYKDITPIGFITLARWVSQGWEMPSHEVEWQVVEAAFAALSIDESERVTTLQTSALLTLKRMARYTKGAKALVTAKLDHLDWHNSSEPIYREFAEDLCFEMDFEEG